MGVDILFLIPIDNGLEASADPFIRHTMAARQSQYVARGMAAFEEYLGHPVGGPNPDDWPVYDGKELEPEAFRTSLSVTLANILERAGLSWEMVDPGIQDLRFWRKRLEQARANPPKVVGLSTTFVQGKALLQSLCAMIRRILPGSTLLVGGSFYTTDAKGFLSLDADVCCVGEADLTLPRLVRAAIERRSYDDIPGLYVRRPDGSKYSTGRAEPVPLARLPRVDWKLSERIEPPVDISKEMFELQVETQRGCVFKCTFCSFRSAPMSIMPPDDAVEVIFNTRSIARAFLGFTDATATFPHDRWQEIMEKVAARGGAPHPMWCFARVSDLNEKSVSLMARAGVRSCFIGQESGDQRMLNAMRKGTRVEEIAPAMESLHRHGISAQMGIIQGFPGEDESSLRTTREFLGSVNARWPDQPVVLMVHATPFFALDLATVTNEEDLQHTAHFGSSRFSFAQSVDAVLETSIHIAKIPHAPVTGAFGGMPHRLNMTFARIATEPIKFELFRYAKAIDHGAALFVEQELTGKKPNEADLKRIRAEIDSRLPRFRQVESRIERARKRLTRTPLALAHRLQTALQARVSEECAHEGKGGAGPLTRLMLGEMSYQATGNWRSFLRPVLKGEFNYTLDPPAEAVSAELDAMAQGVRTEAYQRSRTVKVSKAMAVAVGPLPGEQEVHPKASGE
jgi:hypothetical protein